MKKLLLMMVAFVACIGVKAQQNPSGGTLTLTPGQVASLGARPSGDYHTIKLVGDFSGGWSGNWFINEAAGTKDGITTIDMSEATFVSTNPERPSIDLDEEHNHDRVKVEPTWGFEYFPDLKNIVWPTAGNIKGIPTDAFVGNGKNVEGGITITIPGYIEAIARDAFIEVSSQHTIKTVIFEDYDDPTTTTTDVNMVISTQAFQLINGLEDVYIETEGDIHAGNNAFAHETTFGQGNPNNPVARLHFPDNKAADYVNQDDPLSEETASSDGLFQAWLVQHYNKANIVGNGFYEFVSNGSSNHTGDEGEVVLKTFSHATIDYVVPKGAKAYVVNAITEKGEKTETADTRTYELTLQRVNVIPHGTGVIIFGGTNAKSSDGNSRYLDMMAVKYEGTAYTRATTGKYHNLLIGNSEGKISNEKTPVEPYDLDESGEVATRNFFMGKFSNTTSGKKYFANGGSGTDFVGFFRAKKGSKLAAGKAYLQLEFNEYKKEDGGEVIVIGDTKVIQDHENNNIESYRMEYAIGTTNIMTEGELHDWAYWWTAKSNDTQHQGGHQITWANSWGTRNLDSGFYMANCMDEFEDGVVTLVLPASMVENEDNAKVYNLQGMEVTNPTKGVYIKNGKKYVVK